MRVGSLRLRLLLLAAASLIIVLIVAGYAFASIFAEHSQRLLESRLGAELDRLVVLTDATTATPALPAPLPDARYEIPAGGLYWQVRDPATGVLLRSRSLWDTALDVPAATDDVRAVLRLDGPAGQRLLALVQSLTFEGQGGADRPLQLIVAEDLAEVDAANAAFLDDLVRALAILAVALLGTSWLTVELGLAPLRRIKQAISRIRSGEAKALDGNHPSEVMPLVAEVNDLVSVQEQSIAFARERAADLAHGLKTSLTLMNGEAFALRASGAAEPAQRLEALTAAMTATIDHQLRLSRLRHRTRADRQSTPLAVAATRIVAALKATPDGRRLDWTVDIPPTLSVALDSMDLSELLGVLFENAAKWASSRVRIEAGARNGQVQVLISDDGPGLAPEAIERLLQRGQRLDESRAGAGLGLAIAQEIVQLNGGGLSFTRSALGGLEVQLELQGSSG